MSENLPDIVQERPPIEPVDPGGQVWERIKGETSAAYTDFVVYRNQTRGRHSIAKAAHELGKGIEAIKDKSSKNRWIERAEAYDDYLERRDRDAREQARDEINRRGMTLAQAGLGAIAARMLGGQFRGQNIEAFSPGELDATDLARWAETFWRMARLASGQPTDAIKGLVTVTTEDHIRIVGDLYQIVQHVLPEELQQRFATLWNQYLDTGTLPWA